MDFGKKIQELRKKNNLSQEDLAEKLGVARQTISKWELGETSPDLKQSHELSKIFNISLDELTNNESTLRDNDISNKIDNSNKTSITNAIGLFFIDIFAVAFFIIMALWILVLAIFSVVCLVIAISLIANINFSNIIPVMPYGCGVVIALTLITLSALSIIGVIWFTYLLRTLINMYKEFHYKVLHGTSITSKKTIPNLSKNKLFQKTTIITVICFITFLILSLIICMTSSSSIDFWHTWNWFK